MKRFLTTLAAAAILVGGALNVRGETYAIDSVHSSAIFRIKHNNTSYLYGRINSPEGTIVYDAANPAASSFDVSLKTANVDTNNAQRDTHLKSPTFFDAKEYPTLTFKSTSVKKGEGDTLEVTGNLTIRGVSKPITVKLEKTGESTQGKPTVGFEGTFTINRSDFEVKEMPGAVGEDVRIIVSFEAGKK